ncbi:heptosyltransferase-2 [Spirosoma lacussanchae]|uniref:glycosyltransferase family 9 protein n=1 Tax=Spirosoma lacussanchae TaxID=1884249 RepID=UPI00110A0239|nr:glycosyltransferase family 9 protein [Spirosoma lacussanchae]
MITDSNPPRFLIIQTAFIGDVILATALLEQLRRARPQAVLDVLVRKGNESLLANHPFLNEVLIWDKKGAKYGSLWALLKTIRVRRYDAVLNLQRFGATGLLTALSNASVTVGFDKNPFSRFFTHRITHKFMPGVHEVNRNAWMLKPLGLSYVRTRPRLYPSRADYDMVQPLQQQSYVCIAPTSVWFTKQYPAERWVELIQSLPRHLTVYLLGAPTDAAVCEKIGQDSGRDGVKNLAGTLTLLQSAALVEGAIMNYVNDSAPLHLCSAMNAPTTAVFCSTVPEFGFGPLANDAVVVQTPELLDCKPCGIHGRPACPLGHFRCAWTIPVEDLTERAIPL